MNKKLSLDMNMGFANKAPRKDNRSDFSSTPPSRPLPTRGIRILSLDSAGYLGLLALKDALSQFESTSTKPVKLKTFLKILNFLFFSYGNNLI